MLEWDWEARGNVVPGAVTDESVPNHGVSEGAGVRQADKAAVLDTVPESCEGPEPNLMDVTQNSASHSERHLKTNTGGLTGFSELEDSAFITIHFSSPSAVRKTI